MLLQNSVAYVECRYFAMKLMVQLTHHNPLGKFCYVESPTTKVSKNVLSLPTCKYNESHVCILWQKVFKYEAMLVIYNNVETFFF